MMVIKSIIKSEIIVIILEIIEELLIVFATLDLSQAHYQAFLIVYQMNFIVINAQIICLILPI